NALPQHRAQWRGEQLGDRLNCVVEHGRASLSLPEDEAEIFAPRQPLRQCARGCGEVRANGPHRETSRKYSAASVMKNMPPLSRRRLLAASAAFAAGPAFRPASAATAPSGGPLDTIIIGAGAAG